MEDYNFIEFKKERDLGAIISDTFAFIRQNWKNYFITILKIVGPVLLMTLAVLVFYLLAISDIFNKSDLNSNPGSVFSKMISWIFALMFVYVMLYSLLSVTSLYFIKSYIDTKGKPDYYEIKAQVYKNVWKFLGLGILVAAVTVLGFIMCYLPGIYFGVALSLATSILVFEERSISYSFSHSFTLIKGQWWNTFGVLIVIWLLIWLLGQVFSIPTIIYQLVKIGTVFGNNDPTKVFEVFKDPIYLALTVGSYVFQFMLYSIPLISIVFIYFDLNEQKNATGTFEKIDNLGNNN